MKIDISIYMLDTHYTWWKVTKGDCYIKGYLQSYVLPIHVAAVLQGSQSSLYGMDGRTENCEAQAKEG